VVLDQHLRTATIIGNMSETPTSTEPTTGPIAAAPPPAVPPTPPPAVPPTPPPPAPHEHERRPSKLTAVAAWVGIVAGTVFVVAVIFFSGFILGAHSGGGGHHWGGGPGEHRGGGQMHEDGRPMGPMFRPGPGFIFPGGPGGFPGFGPGMEPGGPGAPGQPGTSTPPGR
jgi:hypothetical protein